MNTRDKVQKIFFEQENNRYTPKLILHPPMHTKFEIELIIKAITNLEKKGLIVDFAAGTGRVSIPLLQKSFRVLAVDISRSSLRQIRRIADSLGLKKLRLSTKIEDSNIKVIVGADALHHVDMDKYLKLFYQVLPEGGKIVFSEPGAWNLLWYIYLGLFHDWQVEKGMMNCSLFNLQRKLIKYGFNKIKISGLGLFPRPFFNWSPFMCRLNDWLGNLPILKLFAYRYIIEAEK